MLFQLDFRVRARGETPRAKTPGLRARTRTRRNPITTRRARCSRPRWLVKKLLIVDDDPALLSALSRALRGTFEITTCADGADAIALLSEGKTFDAILCDNTMREVCGVEVGRYIDGRHPELRERFVLMTGGEPPVVRWPVLIKPVAASVVRDAFRALLDP